jgi:protein BCP1
VAAHTIDYSFTHATPRDKESFGLDTGGRMMLVAADQLAVFAQTIGDVYAA